MVVLRGVAGARHASGWLVSTILVGACAAPAPPLASEPAKEEEQVESPEEAAPPEPVAESVEDAAPATAASEDDVRQVLQLVIEDPEIVAAFRLEQPGRLPFRISRRNLPFTPELLQAGRPVTYVDAPGDEQQAVLSLTEVEIGPKRAWVKFRYSVGDVSGSASLEKTDAGWQIQNSRVVER